MEPQYMGIVNNLQTSDGSGFFVTARSESQLEKAVLDILSGRIKEDIENEILYGPNRENCVEGCGTAQFDYSKIPDFVKKHTQKISGTEYCLNPSEEQYETDLGFRIEDNPSGLAYSVQLHDIRGLPTRLKTELSSLAPDKFAYLHELDFGLLKELQDEIDLSY